MQHNVLEMLETESVQVVQSLLSFTSDSLDISPARLPALWIAGGFVNSAAMQMYADSRGSGQCLWWGLWSRDIKVALQISLPPVEIHQ